MSEVVAKIHINIGSNQNRRQNLKAAVLSLKSVFRDLQISKVYESPSYGFEGADFYNVGVNALSDLSVENTALTLREIEQKQGRERNLAKFSDRNIDLDLILYDDLIDAKYNLPRGDILRYDFVLAPLAELNPDLIHPLKKQNYRQLLSQMKLNKRLKSYNTDLIL